MSATDLDRGAKVFWVLLEIVAALAIAVAIVWWTFPRKARGEDAAKREEPPRR